MKEKLETQKYFSFHYKLFMIFGLGKYFDPIKKNFNSFSDPLYLIYSIFQHIFWTFCFPIALWLEVPRLYKDLDCLMLNLTFSITFTLTFIKLAIVLIKNVDLQKLVYILEVELTNFVQSNAIVKNTIKISKRMTYAVLIFANSTVVGLIVGGIFQWFGYAPNSVASPKDRLLPVPVYLPYEVSSNFLYSLTFLYQIFGVLWCGNLVVLINTFMNAIMVHAAGQFANLRFVLENIELICLLKLSSENVIHHIPENNMLNSKLHIDELRYYKNSKKEYMKMKLYVFNQYGQDFFDKFLCKCMKECIVYHKSIIMCVYTFERIYSFGFLIHIINNLNIICHVMIQISENDVLSFRFGTAVALFFTVVSEFLVQCYAGNELSLQATGVAESAFNCQWYASNRDFKRMILILMIRAQKFVKVKAGNIFIISNATFVKIMKGAYSFYAVIRSTKKNI